MASTWSSLKIELLETGQNPGTWGTSTNVNLGDAVLGEAITGQATVDFPSDADVTITLTDSATTQAARNLRLNITESSTGVGSVRSLILGSGCQIEKFYLINNTGTGAKTVKNTSGTGITVPAGKATLVFNNGTNVVDAASYFTSLTLGSALPVASGGTGLTAGTSGGILGYTATGTLASSVALTANALVLGAGAGATPTPMASLGTTTTVLHGNASGAPTFGAVSLTADVTGTLPTANGGTNLTSFTSGGVVYASSTSALATGSALYFSGTNLGIATTSPQRLLDVRGAVNFSTTAPSVSSIGYADIHLRTFSGATNSPARITVVDNWFDCYSTFTDGFRWLNWSSDGVAAERMTLTGAGNLGIGTSSPATQLHVANTGTFGTATATGIFIGTQTALPSNSSRPSITVQNGWVSTNGDLAINARTDAPGNIRFYAGNGTAAEIVTMTYTGDVGIGIYPVAKLDVNGTIKSLTTISVGAATPSSSGAGITFPATQSDSSNANTLDDYEEGTWTPIDGSAGTLTFTANTGFYTKIGNLVTAQGVFTYPVTAGGNAARVAGLPFSQTNVTTAGGYVTSNGGANLLMIQSPYAGAVQFYKVGDVTEVNAALSGQTVAITLIYRTT